MLQRIEDLWPRGEPPSTALCGDDARLALLAAHGTSALVEDPELNAIVTLAARICATPLAAVTVIERDHQVFLARLGLAEDETPRPISFCAHAMLGSEAMVIPDATIDDRFHDNPLVTAAPHIRFYAGHPLISAEGAPLGALCVIDTVPRPTGLTELQREALAVMGAAVMRRLGQRRLSLEARHEIDQREAQLRRMIDSVPDIAFSADAAGNFDYFNARWEELTGRPPPAVATAWRPFVHPEDFAASLERWNTAVRTVTPFEDQWRLHMADGSWRWVLSRVVPVVTKAGPARWFGVLTDIDAVHREKQAKDLLAAELSHRIKNIFAVISGIISIRARGKPELSEFATELGTAVRALGTAHDYVRPVEGRSSDCLQGLLRDLLAPYDHGDARHVTVTGADIEIGPRAATPLALIFHELATNSAKYGALASDSGEVAVEIAAPDLEEGMLRVTWRETSRDGLPTTPSGGEGFGSRLLRLAIENQLGGNFQRNLREDGMTIEIAVAASRVSA
ncbi:sensor histidine kinase [Erythrobacter mangrovi]|uniref:histidine kinase n=1 Tax=Erythrobacter mangrovi TaxID=2739433 RepID=A0A7D4C312_9SPHN|nr:PAS domain-containing protein [Erythrobacter mangrovi]QKG70705.1 PAS domain-containing protein [Erythrobacter mangrovi]